MPMTSVSTIVSSVMVGPNTAIPWDMQEATSAALWMGQLSDQCARSQALTTSIRSRKKKSASLLISGKNHISAGLNQNTPQCNEFRSTSKTIMNFHIQKVKNKPDTSNIKKTYLRSERSLCKTFTTLQVKTKLEKTVNNPARPNDWDKILEAYFVSNLTKDLLRTNLEWDRWSCLRRWYEYRTTNTRTIVMRMISSACWELIFCEELLDGWSHSGPWCIPLLIKQIVAVKTTKITSHGWRAQKWPWARKTSLSKPMALEMKAG